MKFTTTIPLSLYIHLPWCVQKCPYCDFNSHAVRDSLPEDLYVNALLNDLDTALPLVWGRRLVSIFFGGGTPSLFSAAAIEKILQGVHARFNFGAEIEITLEANPGTVDESRFAGFKKAGVNRLSLGIQSLQNEKLKVLGRIHDSEHALRAIDAALAAGFSNFNLDIMHGLPNQSLADAIHDLQTALRYTPPHFSWYQLTIEPNTLFHHQPPVLPDENILGDIQEHGKKIIAQHQLQQYEVSAYAQKKFECIHNQNYWEFGDYLGIGAGAHSKITDCETQTISRYVQTKHPKEYLNRAEKFTVNSVLINEKEVVFEFMLNALRLVHGVPINLFTERTGLPLDVIAPQLKLAYQKKLLKEDATRLCATELGQRFLNDLIKIFM